MMDYTRKILDRIRKESSSSLNEATDNSKSLINEDETKGNGFVLRASDAQFGSVRSSQEDTIRKTVGDVEFKDDALTYYAQINDLCLNGTISGLDVNFQFRYKDPSGDGCYIWCKGLQLTDSNLKTIDKVRDAFLNWKQSLVEDGDLMEKLHKEATKE